jgi:hypothetical protein
MVSLIQVGELGPECGRPEPEKDSSQILGKTGREESSSMQMEELGDGCVGVI